MISARPGINGNSREDFYKAMNALLAANNAVAEARRALFSDVLHGRNYQHISDENKKLIEDRQRVFNLMVAMQSELETLTAEVIESTEV